MGKELVLWRSMKGELALQDAYCPHLGTHLGHCGKVVGEKIRCPFHGLTFNGDGKCASHLKRIEHSSSTSSVSIKTYPIKEQNGIIFSSFDSQGKFANWEIAPLDLTYFTP